MRCFCARLLVWFAIGMALTCPVGLLINQTQMSSIIKDGTPMALSTAGAIMALAVAALLKYSKPKPKRETNKQGTP